MRSFLITLTMLCLGASLAVGQQPGRGSRPGMDRDRMRTQMAERDRIRAQAMAHADSADARLDRLAAEMNAATGSRKVDAMAALLNEMVAQHREMRRMRQQMGAMMGGGGMGPGMMQKQQSVPADSGPR